MFNFLRDCAAVFCSSWITLRSSQQCRRLPISLHPHRVLPFLIFLITAILVGVKCYFTVALICICLVTNEFAYVLSFFFALRLYCFCFFMITWKEEIGECRHVPPNPGLLAPVAERAPPSGLSTPLGLASVSESHCAQDQTPPRVATFSGLSRWCINIWPCRPNVREDRRAILALDCHVGLAKAWITDLLLLLSTLVPFPSFPRVVSPKALLTKHLAHLTLF